MLNANQIDSINQNLAEMQAKHDLSTGMELAKTIMELVTERAAEIDIEDVQDSYGLTKTELKNVKTESWFQPHPYLGGQRSAFELFDEDTVPVEAKFFHLSERVNKSLTAGVVQLTPNWEDDDLTKTGEYKVGIDFLLTADGKSLVIVLSKNGNLRLVELNEKLSTTQVGILGKICGAGDLPTHEAAHETLWSAFALKEVNKDFYEGIAKHFGELVASLENDGHESEASKLFASRLLGRLLFCWFLRKKGIIADDLGYFDPNQAPASDYYETKLKKLFFQVLNTPIELRADLDDNKTPYLNGGLFEAHEDDWYEQTIPFPEGYFVRLYDHFDKFNFTTDESSPDYEQVAIDPEMLGRVFESLLATLRAETAKNARTAKGTYYTPREIVNHMCRQALRYYLYSKVENKDLHPGIDKLLDASEADVAKANTNFKRGLWGEKNQKLVSRQVLDAIDDLKILDPACGSGAFPMGMMHLLTRTLERLDPRLDPYKTKLNIIKNSLYGVDIEPMAIEIAKLRTWLALAVDEVNTARVEPLPNLDFKFICANSLKSLAPEHDGFTFEEDREFDIKLADIRANYFATTAPSEKEILKKNYYEIAENAVSAGYDERVQQLQTFDPFQFHNPAEFFDPQQMFGVSSFDIVVGNPPYVGEQGNKKTFDAIKGSDLHERFYQGKMDFFYYFFHLGIDVLTDEGVLAFITTDYYPKADGGSNLRTDIAKRTKVLELIDFKKLTLFESAQGQHDLITVLQKCKAAGDYLTTQTVVTESGMVDQQQLMKILSADSSLARTKTVSSDDLFYGVDNLIIFLSDDPVLELTLRKMSKISTRLPEVVNVNQGIVSGADKFSNAHTKKFPDIDSEKGDGIFVFPSGQESFSSLRPWFKNSDISRYVTAVEPKYEVAYLSDEVKPTQAELNYLKKYQEILRGRRGFGKGGRPWYELSWARDVEIFEGPKIIWPQRRTNNDFAYNDTSWYASADVYFATYKSGVEVDLFFLLGLLNSGLIFTWLYHRGKEKGDMLELYATPIKGIPVARDADLEKKIGGLAKKAYETLSTSPDADISEIEADIDKLVYKLYGLNKDEIGAVSEFIDTTRPK